MVIKSCWESQNGREVRIDILEDGIRIPETFQSGSRIFPSTEGLPEPPGEVMGLHGPYGREEAAHKGWPRPLLIGSPNWTLEGGAPPFPSPHPLPSLLSGKGKGVQLGLGVLVGLPSLACPLGRPPPPLLLYIRGRGHPKGTTIVS